MPTGNRIRANSVYGTISDNPLLFGSPTFNSSSLPLLPVVASAHAVVVLDPQRVHGNPEIIVVTGHTISSTVATVLRGQYSTLAREHPQGTMWAHVPMDEDFIEIVTSVTRPSNPYTGQMIYETDTVGYQFWNGSAWSALVPAAAWASWTPSYSNITVGAGVTIAKYGRVGRNIHYKLRFTLGAGSAMSTAPRFTLPVSPSASTYPDNSYIGHIHMTDMGSNISAGFGQWAAGSSSVLIRVFTTAGSYISFGDIAPTLPFSWVSGSFFEATGTYEASS